MMSSIKITQVGSDAARKTLYGLKECDTSGLGGKKSGDHECSHHTLFRVTPQTWKLQLLNDE
jgi:hypothetical protein